MALLVAHQAFSAASRTSPLGELFRGPEAQAPGVFEELGYPVSGNHVSSVGCWSGERFPGNALRVSGCRALLGGWAEARSNHVVGLVDQVVGVGWSSDGLRRPEEVLTVEEEKRTHDKKHPPVESDLVISCGRGTIPQNRNGSIRHCQHFGERQGSTGYRLAPSPAAGMYQGNCPRRSCSRRQRASGAFPGKRTCALSVTNGLFR